MTPLLAQVSAEQVTVSLPHVLSVIVTVITLGVATFAYMVKTKDDILKQVREMQADIASQINEMRLAMVRDVPSREEHNGLLKTVAQHGERLTRLEARQSEGTSPGILNPLERG